MVDQVKLVDVPSKHRGLAIDCLERFEEMQECDLCGFTFDWIGSFSIYNTRARNTIIRFYPKENPNDT